MVSPLPDERSELPPSGDRVEQRVCHRGDTVTKQKIRAVDFDVTRQDVSEATDALSTG